MRDRGMKERWGALFPDAAADRASDPVSGPPGTRRDLVDAAGDDLIARWTQPHRRYHTLAHLRRMLDVLDAHGDVADDPIAVALACWFHDAIYDPTRGDNEAASAALAVSTLASLGVSAGRRVRVERLVLLTATHDVATGDRDGALLCDADLAILAASPDDYADYTRAVRAEYAFAPDAAFAAGRADILRRFLDRPVIYHVPTLRRAWERQARANVLAEIDALAGAARNL